jgi:DNA-binding NtrC family response regulator
VSEILIVDDEKSMRELIRRWLQAEGLTVCEAPDSESALKVLAERPIAVVTIDKDMPGHPGTWLVERIQESYPAVAMLLSTGDDQIPPRVSLSRGVQGYMIKPLKRELVVGAVKDATVWHRVAAKQAKQHAADANPVDAWLQGGAGGPTKEDK